MHFFLFFILVSLGQFVQWSTQCPMSFHSILHDEKKPSKNDVICASDFTIIFEELHHKNLVHQKQVCDVLLCISATEDGAIYIYILFSRTRMHNKVLGKYLNAA